MRTITVKDLARDAKEFLRFKRSMGITYQRGEHGLDSFLRFVVQRWGNAKIELDDVPDDPVQQRPFATRRLSLRPRRRTP